jgi:hypothetical protein
MLDGKSAFDVVIHANLIRRIFQIGISKQSILLLQNLYQNAKMNFNISLKLSSFSHANTHSLVLKTNNHKAINLTKRPATNVNCGFYHDFLNRKLLLISEKPTWPF